MKDPIFFVCLALLILGVALAAAMPNWPRKTKKRKKEKRTLPLPDYIGKPHAWVPVAEHRGTVVRCSNCGIYEDASPTGIHASDAFPCKTPTCANGIEGCGIKRPHSHTEALMKRMKGK